MSLPKAGGTRALPIWYTCTCTRTVEGCSVRPAPPAPAPRAPSALGATAWLTMHTISVFEALMTSHGTLAT